MIYRSLFCLFLMLSLGAAARAQFQQPPPPVVVDTAERTMLAPSVEVPGTVVSRFDSQLASELNAKLEWIAEVGAEVKKGDAVAKLEDITFRLREMELEGEVKREQARVTYLKSEVARLQELQLKNNAAKSLLEKTVSDLGVAESDEIIAQARLNQAKVAMHVTQIRAPFDGIVVERLRSVGERLGDGDEVIRLVDPKSIEVVARAPLNTVNFIEKDSELRLANDYKNGMARVRAIVPFGNPQSHMFEVRLDVEPDTWVVGEGVRVSMPTSLAREVLTVPRDALVLRREGASVFRVNDDMSVNKISVITGQGGGDLIEVMGEINAGDTVVVRGAEGLSDGMTVSVSSGSGGGSSAPSSQ